MARVPPRKTAIPRAADVAAILMEWFARAARDLPWRRTLDPYAIWVSEAMLQQTQVATVIPYWNRWMAELPDVRSLAHAPADKVLKLWEGLGYYRRARHLHAAARQIVEARDGSLPSDLEGWLALPGIGRYTAGAIVSIAFNHPAPILDGNVMRVLSRLLALPGDAGQRAFRDSLWSAAGRLVAAASDMDAPHALPHAPLVRLSGPCSALNQSLMELGATTCTPASPHCQACPVSERCRARKTRRTADFPRPAPRPSVAHRTMAAVLWQSSGRWLVLRRAEGTVNGGLWEFPTVECNAGEDPRASLAAWLGIDAARLSPAGTVRHAITRYRIEQHLFRLADAAIDATMPPGAEWKPWKDLPSLPWTSAHRRALRLITT